jgi:uncharacterized protein (DUF2249 family)
MNVSEPVIDRTMLEAFTWNYVETGPETWKVRVARKG